MLRTAQEAVSRARLSDRIILKHALAEELTPHLFGSEQKFDHAIFSYSLSMIPDWRAAILAAGKAVRSDGFIHVVDFGDLRSLWPLASAALRAWLRLFHVAPRDELLNLLERSAQASPGWALHLLPGRYAFVLKATPAAIAGAAIPPPGL
jgi:S-adenosylmethionine-diacylgycerolhomoserine-N-methlytransferase